MPRRTVLTEPRERFTLPEIREAWAGIEPVTLTIAAQELRLTTVMMKHRRQDAEKGQFPPNIPVQGHWRQASALYDRRLMELWRGPEDDLRFDLRAAPQDRVEPIVRQVETVAKLVQPVVLTWAAETLIDLVMSELSAAERKEAKRAVREYRAAWKRDGRKPDETPEVIETARRRMRSWRETFHANGFPAALPIAAEYRTGEMVFSLPELRAWLEARRKANG